MKNKDLAGIAKHVKERLSERMSIQEEYTDDAFGEIIEECVVREMNDIYLTTEERREVKSNVFNSMRRFDFLQPFLEDDDIKEIMINGTENIFIEKNGRLIKIETEEISEDKLYEIIQNMVSKSNRTVNESSPIVDISMTDGSRANIVLKPLALNGPCITIRKFPKRPITMKGLVENNSITPEMAVFLREIVTARNNILVSGGTSSGKTTLLNVLSECIAKDERVITIEDSAELQILNVDNIVSLEARNKNFEGEGEIGIRKLVKTAMRMRPDRIIVGEVRDGAALDMIQALNSGHDGSMSTIHANSAEDSLLRLETMAMMAEPIPIEAIRRQIAAAINIIIHTHRDHEFKRSIKNIVKICGVSDGQIQTKEIYSI